MSPKKILIISDAWLPQVNGVVRTLEATIHALQNLGHTVHVIGPDIRLWKSFALPSYPSIILEFFGRQRLLQAIEKFQPDFIHLATEGPLGWSGRNACLKLNYPFTTSYHTRFPEYLAARVPHLLSRIILNVAYAILRRFHTPSSAVMVATASIEHALHVRKFRRLVRWSRGVDTKLFRPYGKNLESFSDLLRPILLYVGRISVEKNLDAFLNLETSGSKVIIGDGPDRELLERRYPEAHFLGPKSGIDLAKHYAAADLFVFPSTTDTFGLVLLEACACGLRIASYPAPGPIDIFSNGPTNTFVKLDNDLQRAVSQALQQPDIPSLPQHFAETFSWQSCTIQFLNHLQAPAPDTLKRLTRLRHWLKRR